MPTSSTQSPVMRTAHLAPTVFRAGKATLAGATFAGTTLLAACSDAPKPAAESTTPAIPVSVATVSDAAQPAVVSATGTYLSRDEIPLAFKIGGVVARVLVDEGQSVHRGQLLAALDVREIDALVSKAQAATDKAQRDQARVQRLVTDSVATAVQLQDATTALDAARADLQAARVNREYALITAPEEGVVLRRMLTPGSNVAAGTPAFMLGGSRRGRVLRVGLPDRDALRVQLGDSADVAFDAVPGTHFRGSVVLVGQSADPRTGTYAVEVVLRGADALPSGLVGRVTLQVRERRRARGLTVPVEALLEADKDSATVYTVPASGDLIAQPQRVSVAQLTGERVAVQGLAPDTRVVTRGAAYLMPGARVRIVP